MIKFTLTFAMALGCLVFAVPAAAQAIDWNSDLNKTWWSGITQAELQELVAESGGTWRDMDDVGAIRQSRIDWPDLKNVLAREEFCPSPGLAMPEQNCGAMLLSSTIERPVDPSGWWGQTGGWLAFGLINSDPALYRFEILGRGTTRGNVLSALITFRSAVVRETALLKASGS